MSTTAVKATQPGAGHRRGLPQMLRRCGHHGAVLVAAALTVLVSGTVLAALAVLAGGAVESGAQERLAADPDSVVKVFAKYRADGLAPADAAVRGALAGAFKDVPVRTYPALRAPSARSMDLAVVGPGGKPLGSEAVGVVAFQGAARHAELVAGRWPAPGSGTEVPAALERSLAGRLHLGVGDTLRLSGAKATPVVLKVTGLYRGNGRDPGVWASLTSASRGVDSLAVVPEASFRAHPGLAGDALAAWIGVPDIGRLGVGEIQPLNRRLAAFEESDRRHAVFHGATPALESMAVSAPLTEAIDRIGTPMVVARSGLYIPAALLAALAAATLVLTARQVAEHRRADTALLGARGAGAARLIWSAAAEWAVVAVPAALAAPFLAGPLLSVLDRAGLLPGEVPHSALTTVGWAAALVALALHGIATLGPVLSAARDRSAVAKLRQRGAKSAAFQRAGTDLVLAAVAVLGWLQLRRYHSPVSGNGTVDPVLVLVPVVVTVAATLLTLRLLPFAEYGAAWLARRSAGLVLPLGGWQVSRRATRQAGPALLMVLALAVGALTTSALVMLDRSNTDRARFQVGADLRVQPDEFTAGAVSGPARHSAYSALPGITAATPVVDVPVAVAGDSAGVTAIDTQAVSPTLGREAGAVPALRGDLKGKDTAQQIAALGNRVPEDGFVLPGRPTSLALDLNLDATGPAGRPTPQLTLTIEDGAGLADTVRTALPLPSGERRTVTVPLGKPGGARYYPLRITRMAIELPSEPTRRTYELRLHAIRSDGAPGRTPDRMQWRSLLAHQVDPASAGCPGTSPVPRSTLEASLCGLKDVSGGEVLDAVLRGPDASLRVASGAVELGPLWIGAAPVPALASDAMIAGGLVKVGETVTLDTFNGVRVTFKVTGRIAAVPGFPHGQGRLLVDSRAFAAAVVQTGAVQFGESFWWLSAKDGDAAAAAGAVRGRQALGTGTDVRSVQRQLEGDPLQHGSRGVLVLCLLVAPLFAVIGFTMHAVQSTRERRREFALLRAIGVRKGQLTGLLWTEQVLIAVIAVLLGSAIGSALAGLVMPLVTVDDQGQQVFPTMLATVPWGRVALTALGTAVVISVTVTVMSRMLSRVDLVRVMRAGER
ncbi:ABC transporter permease [Streptomyces beijiangensis]|uniref:FtsX-like permease family protein n=1 Tax=Streptomyces beijiangensis TaxID=163361 RepID=A0A939F805_9ACTN|nr:ABC transporter permease [Streptomyces beijiangensis]MBO0513263.1 FtsX-like permease family protein [Streptomyces beijiangensis]